jgi:hypothetical protein
MPEAAYMRSGGLLAQQRHALHAHWRRRPGFALQRQVSSFRACAKRKNIVQRPGCISFRLRRTTTHPISLHRDARHKKTGPKARFFHARLPAQLRSARAVRLRVPLEAVVVSVLVEPLAPMLPEPLVPELVPLAPMVEPEPLVPPAVLPVVLLPPEVVPAAVPLLVGVPVAPIGVCCVLRWPAPTAGSLAAGLGGVLCAMAVLVMATAATPASRLLSVMDAVMVDS